MEECLQKEEHMGIWGLLGCAGTAMLGNSFTGSQNRGWGRLHYELARCGQSGKETIMVFRGVRRGAAFMNDLIRSIQ